MMACEKNDNMTKHKQESRQNSINKNKERTKNTDQRGKIKIGDFSLTIILPRTY